ncbi:MAG: hypothetical protein IOC52_00890 [Methylobacterium sp.]|jgi:hypothetical protein|nr:hypothetical protein [Methylobacterium sp.]
MFLQRLMTPLREWICRLACSPPSLHPIRRDWPECCRDEDIRRQIVISMREECRWIGF